MLLQLPEKYTMDTQQPKRRQRNTKNSYIHSGKGVIIDVTTKWYTAGLNSIYIAARPNFNERHHVRCAEVDGATTVMLLLQLLPADNVN